MKYVQDWIIDHPIALSALKYLIWLIVIIFVVSFLRKVLKRSLPDNSIRYKSQKIIEILGYVLILFMSVAYFTGNIKDFTLAIGLLTAGIAITLQELILSIAGSFYIFFVRVYKPGDRIEIHGIKGDVIDIDSIYTTIMEIGEWVSSDNYSGRIVKLSNAFVFKGPIYNYSKDFPFIWDEFNILLRYGSDITLAKALLIKIAQETLSDYVSQSIETWKKVVNKYYVEDAMVEPTIAITLTDNWVQCNLRYIVDYRKRRHTQHLLQEKIKEALEKTEGKIQLASTTVEIVKVPSIHLA